MILIFDLDQIFGDLQQLWSVGSAIVAQFINNFSALSSRKVLVLGFASPGNTKALVYPWRRVACRIFKKGELETTDLPMMFNINIRSQCLQRLLTLYEGHQHHVLC